jgi:hypothetical protein
MAQCIFCAFRPLTIEEFSTAMTLQSASKIGRLYELEFVRGACDRFEREPAMYWEAYSRLPGQKGLLEFKSFMNPFANFSLDRMELFFCKNHREKDLFSMAIRN